MKKQHIIQVDVIETATDAIYFAMKLAVKKHIKLETPPTKKQLLVLKLYCEATQMAYETALDLLEEAKNHSG